MARLGEAELGLVAARDHARNEYNKALAEQDYARYSIGLGLGLGLTRHSLSRTMPGLVITIK